MYPEVIYLVSDSGSDSSSVNGDQNGSNEQQVQVTVVHEKAAQLREKLKTNGWVEVNAKNVKDDIDRIYASEGEVWNYNGKGIDPAKSAIKGNLDCCD